MNEELVLKQRMDRTRLIQRLTYPNEFANGLAFGSGPVNGGLTKEAMDILNEVFSFDYMGASEFEWGAVPAALSFLGEQASIGALVSGEHQSVYYLCPSTYETGVKSVIDTLLTNENDLPLQERCGLKQAVNPDGKYRREDLVGWLELDNGFFFFTDKTMFENTKRIFDVE